MDVMQPTNHCIFATNCYQPALLGSKREQILKISKKLSFDTDTSPISIYIKKHGVIQKM